MYSGDCYGEHAFSELPFTPLDTSAFELFLAEISGERVWLLELDAFSLASVDAISSAFGDAGFGELGFADANMGVSGGPVTLRYSSDEFISKGGDLPAYTVYEPSLVADQISCEREIGNDRGIGGLTPVFSQVTLLNHDGNFDLVPENYALHGRRARVLIGPRGGALSAFGLVFTGVVEKVEVGEDVAKLRLSDGAAALDVPVNPNVYGGAGGLDGADDLKGKPKPVVYGCVFNVPPPLVDSALLIYQVHDGIASDVPKCFDRGIELAKGVDYVNIAQMLAVPPVPGGYRICKDATGTWFRLGAQPDGTVTCDVLGDASAGGYVDRTGDIVRRLLTGPAALSSGSIDPSSFANFNTDAPQVVGTWIWGGTRLVGAVVDELLAGVGAFGGFSRYGAFTVGVVTAARGTSAALYTSVEIRDVKRLPRAAPVEPIVFRTKVGWQRNWTVQNDLAAAVPASHVSFAAQEERHEIVEDIAIRSRHRLAVEYVPPASFFTVQADALEEAQRTFDLWSGPRVPYDVELPLLAMPRDLGQVVTVLYPRFGFAMGRDARVIGHRVNGSQVTLKVLA